MIIYVVGGLILAVLSLPLISEKFGPNGLYGFRVRATLENPKLWYTVNKYAGMRLLVVGVITILAAVGLYFIPGLSVDAYALACLGVFGLVFIAAIVQSVLYMRSVQK
jgi:hypothetical protein